MSKGDLQLFNVEFCRDGCRNPSKTLFKNTVEFFVCKIFSAPSVTDWETAPAVAETPEIKLFGKWSTDDVQINDISLQVAVRTPLIS